jgi:hypothetical protein
LIWSICSFFMVKQKSLVASGASSSQAARFKIQRACVLLLFYTTMRVCLVRENFWLWLL